MRAHEFINESKEAKISKRNQQSTRGLSKFRDMGAQDRIYELNRVMMATACADGSNNKVDIDQESWNGRYNTAHAYTELEQKMLKQAFKAVGAKAKDLNKGDLRSLELDMVNKQSPVVGFKGFKK
jgi:RNA-splicing ligase RtcB